VRRASPALVAGVAAGAAFPDRHFAPKIIPFSNVPSRYALETTEYDEQLSRQWREEERIDEANGRDSIGGCSLLASLSASLFLSHCSAFLFSLLF
jgi:hypothetical protein